MKFGQGNVLTSVCHSVHRVKGVSVGCYFLSGCLVPYSFWGFLCLVPCSFQGVSVWEIPLYRWSLYSESVCMCVAGVSVQLPLSGGLCLGGSHPHNLLVGYENCLKTLKNIMNSSRMHTASCISWQYTSYWNLTTVLAGSNILHRPPCPCGQNDSRLSKHFLAPDFIWGR